MKHYAAPFQPIYKWPKPGADRLTDAERSRRVEAAAAELHAFLLGVFRPELMRFVASCPPPEVRRAIPAGKDCPTA
jgi:hypothetical protein